MKEGKRMKTWMNLILQSKWLYILMLVLAGAWRSNAQDNNSSYSDSAVIDIVEAPSQNKSQAADTSQSYFNWKPDVNQPYSNRRIGSRVSADTEVSALKKDDAFWYVNTTEKLKASLETVFYDKAQKDSLARKDKAAVETRRLPQEEAYNFNLPSWTGTLIWCIIVAVFLLAVGYFLLANKINIFSRSGAKNNVAENDGEAIDLFNIPYQELLQKAYFEKNYRLAVRILYLQTLKLLNEKNIITFQADYTNMDYLQQLSQTMFYKDFFAITRHYEYVWYGGFAVSEPAFYTIRNDFNSIQDKIARR